MKASPVAVALCVPMAVLGTLYAVAVRPQRAQALEAQHRLKQARAHALTLAASQKPASGDVREPAHVLRDLLSSPVIGGVQDLSIRSAANELAVTFDASHGQVGRFFWTLPTQPVSFDVRSVELTPGAEGLVHAAIALVAHNQERRPPALPAERGLEPQWKRNPFTPLPAPSGTGRGGGVVTSRSTDPTVSGILESAGRRVAVVDGRIVGPGDLVGTSTVQSIEPEAVVIAGPDGRPRRLPLRRPAANPAGPM
jgi:hypothetical protein